MKRFLFFALALVLLSGTILAGCGETETSVAPTTAAPAATTVPKPAAATTSKPAATTAPAAPKGPSGTLTVAVADFSNESTDPINLESTWGWSYYDALLEWDKDGNIVGGVAESWMIDGTTITFTIRKGIKFHNGDPLTAHDVKFSMDRFSDMQQSTNPWSFYLSKGYNQVETRVVDDYTFQFVQDHPEPSQLIIMAWTQILPKNYFEKVGQEEFRKHPIGSGPWKFKELVSETSITYEANTEYWRPDEIPAFQTYKEIQVPEQTTRISMLKTGEVDMIQFIEADKIDELKAAGFKEFAIGVPGTCSLVVQGSWLPNAGATGDIRVRQALSYAINRQEICDSLFAGYAVPGGRFYMYPGGYGWSDALAADPYDPDKAKALLKEAGYPGAFDNPTITAYTTAAGGLSGGTDLFLLLQSYWEAVGMKVDVKVVDSTIFSNYIFNGFARFAGTEENIGWIGCWNYDAFFNSSYQAANMYCTMGVHNGGYDTKIDELYLKATGEPDPVQGAKYFNDFQVAAQEMNINIGVAQTQAYSIYNPKTIGGWTGRTWVSYWDSINGIQHAK
ncbi:MAG: ABC transporter substrate-binding protein [Dehalococcoidales bacterium]|nr:ABC transporter substrate-binding protein [Dehalococcoidales bacterium]